MAYSTYVVFAAQEAVADDEPAVRRVVARCVEALGYRAIQARHAEQALGFVAEEAHIDLVISDLVIPGMDGAELRRAILRRSPMTAVVLMSGHTDDVALGIALLAQGPNATPNSLTER
jgi:two-component system, cell cycle sensor histidine kinase and response regulator CckA